MSHADDLFALAVAIVLEEEGAYSNDPKDPGAETKWGIARAEHPEISAEAWATWSKVDATALYRRAYFDAHRCGEMPAHWAVAVFDAAVNPCGTVIAWAQRSLGVKGDGVVGAQTLAAMDGTFADESLDLFMMMRAEGYLKQPDYETGHIRRLFAVQRMTLQRMLSLPPS